MEAPMDTRLARAEELLAAHLDGSDRWTQAHLIHGGRAIFIIPGTRPRNPAKRRPAYYVDQRDCDCPDRTFRRHEVEACCHMLAVRLWYRRWRSGDIRVIHKIGPPGPDMARAGYDKCPRPEGDTCPPRRAGDPADLALVGVEPDRA